MTETTTMPTGLPGARTTPVDHQIAVDCADPHAQARFWAAALGYEIEVYEGFVQGLLDAGRIRPEDTLEVDGVLNFRDATAIRPAGASEQEARRPGGRLLFQRVPEPKTAKNRWHLDLHVGSDGREAEVERLKVLGASAVREVDEPQGRWTVMADPEGNEFCVA